MNIILFGFVNISFSHNFRSPSSSPERRVLVTRVLSPPLPKISPPTIHALAPKLTRRPVLKSRRPRTVPNYDHLLPVITGDYIRFCNLSVVLEQNSVIEMVCACFGVRIRWTHCTQLYPGVEPEGGKSDFYKASRQINEHKKCFFFNIHSLLREYIHTYEAEDFVLYVVIEPKKSHPTNNNKFYPPKGKIGVSGNIGMLGTL